MHKNPSSRNRTGTPRIGFGLIRKTLTAAMLFGAVTCLATGISACAAMGKSPKGERLMRINASPNHSGDEFINTEPAGVMKPGSTFDIMREFFFPTVQQTIPDTPPPLYRAEPGIIGSKPAGGLRATWLGHSSMLLETHRGNLLLDPVFAHRASPIPLVGPARFHEPPLPVHDLPPLDAVVISHDHYDHLDKDTIQALIPRTRIYAVPLGVGAHLESWGVPPHKIVEMDWGQEFTTPSGITLACTPARHFSGRGLFDRNSTLWCGWAIITDSIRVFYSGDTGMHDGFKSIGAQYGPFDLTLMECGAYNPYWPDIHMTPEQAVQAHLDVRGKLFMPVHWGTFRLAPLTWTEPAERAVRAAHAAGARITLPRPGQPVEPGVSVPGVSWWPDILPEQDETELTAAK